MLSRMSPQPGDRRRQDFELTKTISTQKSWSQNMPILINSFFPVKSVTVYNSFSVCSSGIYPNPNQHGRPSLTTFAQPFDAGGSWDSARLGVFRVGSEFRFLRTGRLEEEITWLRLHQWCAKNDLFCRPVFAEILERSPMLRF